MSGTLYVQGKRILLPTRRAYHDWPRPIEVASFSCHWAAVKALVRLVHKDFTCTNDKADDLEIEKHLIDRIDVLITTIK